MCDWSTLSTKSNRTDRSSRFSSSLCTDCKPKKMEELCPKIHSIQGCFKRFCGRKHPTEYCRHENTERGCLKGSVCPYGHKTDINPLTRKCIGEIKLKCGFVYKDTFN